MTTGADASQEKDVFKKLVGELLDRNQTQA